MSTEVAGFDACPFFARRKRGPSWPQAFNTVSYFTSIEHMDLKVFRATKSSQARISISFVFFFIAVSQSLIVAGALTTDCISCMLSMIFMTHWRFSWSLDASVLSCTEDRLEVRAVFACCVFWKRS